MNDTQCRMARAALRWSLDDLALASGLNRRTVTKFERGGSVTQASASKLRAAFVAQGIDFAAWGNYVSVSCLPPIASPTKPEAR